MDIYKPFQQVSMWSDGFKVEGGLNSIASPMLLVSNTSMVENKVSKYMMFFIIYFIFMSKSLASFLCGN